MFFGAVRLQWIIYIHIEEFIVVKVILVLYRCENFLRTLAIDYSYPYRGVHRFQSHCCPI